MQFKKNAETGGGISCRELCGRWLFLRYSRGVFRPRQTRQLPRAVDLKGWLLSCQSY